MTGIAAALEEGLLILTMDEPERCNPVGHAVRRRLVQLLSDAEHDRAVHAVVLTGAGGHFSTGGDIRDQKAVTNIAEARDRFSVVKDLVGRMVRFPKPLVSAVEGWAAGGGFALALACETVVAAETARFASSFGKIGLIPSMGLLATLPARIGFARAPYHPRLGNDRCAGGVPPRLRGRTRTGRWSACRSQGFRRHCGRSCAFAEAYVKDFLALEVDRALEFERQIQPTLLFSADALEGRAAFFEKRAAVFRGE
ncbi:enoyl-CoA hydratase/carnithine racemase [Rhizobium petrolearium]|uniref:Enoyl-CoA hydratase/isomerase family protein n=2 Tax=Neorhizobium TaxID=1525371 RepID=A0ABV0MAK1_9HYPH|nr:enoyl-CoA hydratase/isomerase family protein [Neorhizobium petrolearium]MBP1847246.1 enoyl-CoA hydratase/carnithine racemase [Neorhizobium petrolearium]MCC2614293.1 enoyl-CoA hydratase/isomerase family protein [Neorhizobium petrolearium]WGI72397.1 enoyl-CoA hydratase/isomerase family protein [Neorhizobium petrolearium]